MAERSSVPRGRHAPPLEVRQDRQRRRLDEAAAAVFARVGYAEATAEAIAREAGMSKATFYEHFDNKEACILALFDTATERLLGAMQTTGHVGTGEERLPPPKRVRESVGALLQLMAEYRDFAQTLLVEIIGAGPKAIARRDAMLNAFAVYINERNREDAEAGVAPRLASEHDAFAVVGAIFELASRQLRTNVPEDIRDLEPVVERLIAGMLAVAEGDPAQA
jgi:AcrR family transcriptional regulator